MKKIKRTGWDPLRRLTPNFFLGLWSYVNARPGVDTRANSGFRGRISLVGHGSLAVGWHSLRNLSRADERNAAADQLLGALLRELGAADAPCRATPLGPRRWPQGLCGSVAHDDAVIVAVVARANVFGSLGIDVEPAEPLPADAVPLVTNPAERRRVQDDPVALRLLFCAKEAVFKALWPRDGRFVEFQDVEVDLANNRAWTRHGALLTLATCRHPRLLAIAKRSGDRRADRRVAEACRRVASTLAGFGSLQGNGDVLGSRTA